MQESLHHWIGRTQEITEELDPRQARLLAATLDQPGERWVKGAALPPLWHWAWFHNAHPTGSLGPDGHAARGEFLPPIALPRRMWAGGRLCFERPVHLGETVTRRSTVVSIDEKEGRSGRLAFVVVRHEFHGPQGLALKEEHDIVYREAPRPGEVLKRGGKPKTDAVWRKTVVADPVLLFRYSAVTFNGHRIHYDVDYCREAEHYPGLVVHGPLMATLMLELLRAQRPDAQVFRFTYRGHAPVFAPARIEVMGRPEGEGRVQLWIEHEGAVAMEGEAVLT